jgi:formylglycine-generating enzyme required for sulfatase activity
MDIFQFSSYNFSFFSAEGKNIFLQSGKRGVDKWVILVLLYYCIQNCAREEPIIRMIPKHRFKIVGWSMVFIMSMSMGGLSAYAQTKAPLPRDLDQHWAKKVVHEWIKLGRITGYPDGTFSPDQSITRAEFMTLVNKAFGFKEEKQVQFSDMTPQSWFYHEVRRAVAAGYIKGYPDGTIRALNPMTRQEAAVVFAALKGLDTLSHSPQRYSDVKKIQLWSAGSFGAVVAAGFMDGYPDGTLQPEKEMNRAEAIVVLDRLLTGSPENTFYSVAGTYGPAYGLTVTDRNVVIQAAQTTLQNLHIRGALTIDAQVGEGTVFLNNLIVEEDTIVRGGGTQSVYLNGGTYQRVVVGNTPTKAVRIVSDTLDPVSLVVESSVQGQTLYLAGVYEEIILDGQTTRVELLDEATVTTLRIAPTAQNATVALWPNAVVTTVQASAATTIKNNGQISNPITGEKAIETSIEGNAPKNASPAVTVAPNNTPPSSTTPPASPSLSSPLLPPSPPKKVDRFAVTTIAVPVAGALPVRTMVESQYTGDVQWVVRNGTIDTPLSNGQPFAPYTAYIAKITLTPQVGFTFEGIGANTFQVTNALSETHNANSGVIEATYAPTGTVMQTVPIRTFTQVPTGITNLSTPVTLDDFMIAQTEVTYAQWYEVYNWAIANGYTFGRAGAQGHDGVAGAAPTERKYEPVTQVSWKDALVWLNALSQRTQLQAVYVDNENQPLRNANNVVAAGVVTDANANGYRLPTDVEIQIAARWISAVAPTEGALATTRIQLNAPNPFYWTPGNYASGAIGESNSQFSTVAWYDDNSGMRTQRVATKQGNALKLYDLSGNVWEWTASGSSNALRYIFGGSAFDPSDELQIGAKSSESPNAFSKKIGFRYVQTIKP